MGIIIAFVILGVIIVGIVSGGVAIYNRLVMLKYNVDKNFANIDVILKQRVDEIPNLIAVVKKTQGYEESLLNQLTELRTAFLSSRSTDEKVQLANEVGKLLNSFFAVSESARVSVPAPHPISTTVSSPEIPDAATIDFSRLESEIKFCPNCFLKRKPCLTSTARRSSIFLPFSDYFRIFVAPTYSATR